MELLHLLIGLSFAAFAAAAFARDLLHGHPLWRSLKELAAGVCDALL